MATPEKPIYRFIMPIGDWSGDGHKRCDYFTIESNKPIKDIREAHFNIKTKTGIDIETICTNARHATIPTDILTKLKAYGYTPSNCYGDETIPCSNDMATIWAILLMKADPELDLTIIVEEELEMIPFTGYDEKGRHIGNVGYDILSPVY